MGAFSTPARVGGAGGVGRDARNQPPIHRLFRCHFSDRSGGTRPVNVTLVYYSSAVLLVDTHLPPR